MCQKKVFLRDCSRSKNRAEPIKKDRVPAEASVPAPFIKSIFSQLSVCNEHPETDDYRFPTNEVNKASNAAQNKGPDEELLVR